MEIAIHYESGSSKLHKYYCNRRATSTEIETTFERNPVHRYRESIDLRDERMIERG